MDDPTNYFRNCDWFKHAPDDEYAQRRAAAAPRAVAVRFLSSSELNRECSKKHKRLFILSSDVCGEPAVRTPGTAGPWSKQTTGMSPAFMDRH